MTALQKIEFEMLKEFVRICDELNLRYYLVCGSALGAAKYGGFIPWDDDVDVALPRPDYDVFCQRAQDMLPKHLFLQNHKTDPNYPMIFSKIRHSGTTYVEKSLAKLNMNHGIYTDIFLFRYVLAIFDHRDSHPKEKCQYTLHDASESLKVVVQ